MRLREDFAEVWAPATASHLGPGLDSMALALGLEDRVHLRATVGATRVEVDRRGVGVDIEDEMGETHPIITSLRAGLERAGAPQVGVDLRLTAGIPRGRGLGERSTSILLGLGAARALIGDSAVLGPTDLVFLAEELGADPTRIPAALRGGCSLRLSAGRAVRLRPPPLIRPVAFVPGFAAGPAPDLPPMAPLAQAAASSARTALLSLLMAGTEIAVTTEEFFEYLMIATEDQLHQHRREGSSPASIALISWLREKDVPAVLAGEGPTVLSLAQVHADVQAAAFRAGWEVLEVGVAQSGLTIGTGLLAGSFGAA